MIDINEYTAKLESSNKIEIVDVLKGKRAYHIANMIFDMDNMDEKSITSSTLIIYKYTPRIHTRLVVKYVIGDSVIGESFDKKHIPEYLKKYI